MKKDSKNKLAASYADAMFEAARAAKAGSRVLSDVETLKSALEKFQTANTTYGLSNLDFRLMNCDATICKSMS